jgi:ubiquitin-conjugating enzyme E2 Z
MTTLKKDTIKRLIHDVKTIIKNPLVDNGIYYSHDEVNMLKGYAMIIGPKNTPYYGGAYFFVFEYPENYPYNPPKVTFKTNYGDIRFNPNLYRNGKVCISILNNWRGESWNSCQTISTVLLHLLTLLCEKPLLNEPNVTEKHIDFKYYNDAIEYSNINIAIIKYINRENVLDDCFQKFYLIYLDYFKTIQNEINDFVNNKINTSEMKIVKIGIYDMRVIIHYNLLKSKLDDIDINEKIEKYNQLK